MKQYTYHDFIKAPWVQVRSTLELLEIYFVDPDAPYIVVFKDGTKVAVHAEDVIPVPF